MKNYKKIIRIAAVVISFLLINADAFAQFRLPIPTGTGTGTGGGTGGFTLPGIGGAPIKPTAGDEPCKATPLKTGLACVQYSNDSSTASTTPGKPTCWSPVVKDVWFSFVATAQDMTVSTDAVIFELFPGTSNNDTEIALYKSAGGACGSLTEMGCDQDEGINSGIDLSQGKSSPTRQGLIERTGLVVGDTYYIRVQGQNGAKGNFCVSAFDTYTVGSKPCEAQVIHPNNMACNKDDGNMVINTTSEPPGGNEVNTIQPGAYVPIGQTWAGCSPAGTATQYGTWTTFTPESSGGGSVTVNNKSGNAVDYTLFSGVCTNPLCVESKPCAVGGNVQFTGIVAGKKYYILTTLQGGATTPIVKTDLCITNASPPVHPPTDFNLNNVPGAGGSQDADHCPAFEIVVDQVYKTTTYAADKDPGKGAPCVYGRTTWFTWKVPSTYPSVNGNSAAFFQMWNKNCSSGPGSIGTRLIVGAAILGDPCSGSCLEFSSPSQTGAAGSSGDKDPYTDAATNVGWDPSKYGNQYWGMFQSGNDGSGDAKENCDFNFMIGSTPSLKGIIINDATICQGSSATLTASGGTAYEWWDGSSAVSRTFSPAVTSTYTVTATAGADGYSVGTITVIPYPFTVSATPGAICSGSSSATLTATSTNTSTLTTTYTWTPATKLNVTSGPTVLASPTVTTTYTVTGTIGQAYGFPGCKASNTAVVTVGGSIPVTVNNGTACPGAGAVLTASGANTYTWTPTTNLSPANGIGTSVTASPGSTTTYTVKGENNGCFGTAQSVVTISTTPTITVNSATICSGLTANLTAAGGATYIWQPGGTTGSTFTTPALNGPTSYTVTGTSAQGCSASAVSNITMASSLTITVTGNGGVCPGNSNTLTAASTGAGTNFTWTPPDFLTSTNSAITTSTPTATVTYTVVGNASGCTGSTTTTVAVTPLDDPTFTYPNYSICPPTSGAAATAVATEVTPGTYSMTPTNNLTLDANTGDLTIPVGATVAAYVVTLKTNGACPSTSSVTVNVVANPTTGFNYPLPNYCKNATPNPTIVLTGNSTGTFSGSPAGLVVDAVTGTIDLTASTPNTYTVTNNLPAGGGCAAASSFAVVTIDPLPSITVTSTVVCGGGSGTISASGATSYTWVGTGTQTLGGVGNADLTDAPVSTTTYVVTGTTNGCSGTGQGTITVSTNPTVTVNNASVCGGVPATLTASGATTYTWSGGFPAGPTLTDSPSTPTSYVVTGTTNGCTGTATGTISINPTPTISSSNSTMCQGQPGGATLTANSSDVVNTTTYVWSNGATTTSINISPASNQTYTVVGTVLGCSGSATGVVTVNPTPVISVTSTTVCSGASASILASSLTATTYTFTPGNTTANPLVVNPATNTAAYTVIGSIGECNSAPAVGTITVNPIPQPTLTPAAPIICTGIAGVLTAASNIPGSTFTWNPPIGVGTNGNDPSPSIGAHTYSVVASALSCTNTATAVITVVGTPTVTTIDTTVCPDVSGTLFASGANTYLWSNGAVTPSIRVKNVGTTAYTVTGSSNGCSDVATATYIVTPAPKANFTEPTKVNLSEATITLEDKSTNADFWFWDFGDTATSTVQDPVHQYSDTGTFVIWLKVTSLGGCSDYVQHTIRVVPDVLVYIPNAFTPNDDDLNEGFGFKGMGVGKGFEFRIFNRWGEQMFYTTDINQLWKGDNKGMACPQDVYVYSILIKDSDGKEKKFMGHVNLIR